jgi:hypothetical protein
MRPGLPGLYLPQLGGAGTRYQRALGSTDDADARFYRPPHQLRCCRCAEPRGVHGANDPQPPVGHRVGVTRPVL